MPGGDEVALPWKPAPPDPSAEVFVGSAGFTQAVGQLLDDPVCDLGVIRHQALEGPPIDPVESGWFDGAHGGGAGLLVEGGQFADHFAIAEFNHGLVADVDPQQAGDDQEQGGVVISFGEELLIGGQPHLLHPVGQRGQDIG